MQDSVFDTTIRSNSVGIVGFSNIYDIPDPIWQELYDVLYEFTVKHLSDGNSDHVLKTGPLLDAAIPKLSRYFSPDFDRFKFFAAASKTMRRVLIDCVRERNQAAKKLERGTLVQVDPYIRFGRNQFGVQQLHALLKRLSKMAPEESTVAELIAFGGMTGDQVALALEVSPSTVDRRIRFARTWLNQETGM